MKKYSLILLVPLVLLLASTSFATVEVTVFGGTDGTFYRAKTAPFTEHRTFPGVSGKATVKLFNGANGKNMVTDATIRVNGSKVFDEMQFKQKVNYLQKEVDLFEGQNDLEVYLEGKPESKITISITQRIEGDAGAVIGSSGGTLSTSGGNATLTVPPGALNSDVIITAKLITGGTPPGFIPGTVYSFEPSGIQFNEPVIVDIKYNVGSLPVGFIENDLVLAFVENGKWVTIPNSIVDTLNDVVRGTFTHFTEIAIVAPPRLQISNNANGPWSNITEMHFPFYTTGSGLTPFCGGGNQFCHEITFLGQTKPCGIIYYLYTDPLGNTEKLGWYSYHFSVLCESQNIFQTYNIWMTDKVSGLSSNNVTLTYTETPPADFSGAWILTFTFGDSTCSSSPPGTIKTANVILTQENNVVTLTSAEASDVFTGVANGNTIILVEEWQSPPYSAKLTMDLTMQSDGSLAGNYKKEGSGGECSSSATLIAVRPAVGNTYDIRDYFPLRIGDYSIRQDGFQEINIRTETFDGVNVTVNQKIQSEGTIIEDFWAFDPADGKMKQYGFYDGYLRRHRIEPPAVVGTNSMQVGQTFDTAIRECIVDDPNGICVPFNLRVTFAGVETVTTPAGTFPDCIKYTGWAGPGPGENPFTAWFAKGIGQVKEITVYGMENPAVYIYSNGVSYGTPP